jgi:pyruvate/2-oxoglutarate dehydrogenase complex dihydrolipoamide dehydrogenase (E3) component
MCAGGEKPRAGHARAVQGALQHRRAAAERSRWHRRGAQGNHGRLAARALARPHTHSTCAHARAQVRDHASGSDYQLPYDKLVIATGARAIRPAIPGVDRQGVFFVRTIPDARNIRAFIDKQQAKTAVVVGGGYVGVEMADNLALM